MAATPNRRGHCAAVEGLGEGVGGGALFHCWTRKTKSKVEKCQHLNIIIPFMIMISFVAEASSLHLFIKVQVTCGVSVLWAQPTAVKAP